MEINDFVTVSMHVSNTNFPAKSADQVHKKTSVLPDFYLLYYFSSFIVWALFCFITFFPESFPFSCYEIEELM